MRNIVKGPVRGDDFFPRPKLIKKIKKVLDSRMSILLTGPYKSGKTSLVYNLMDTLYEEYHFVYIDVKPASHLFQYYDTLYHILGAVDVFNRRYIDYDEPNYDPVMEIARILNWAKGDKPIVVIFDNPYRVIKTLKEESGDKDIELFFEREQELRRQVKNVNVQFIYAASSDITQISNFYETNETLNDLYELGIPPMEFKEAEGIVSKLLEGLDFGMALPEIHFLCKKFEWIIPFHVQVLIYEIDHIYLETDFWAVDTAIIEQAFKSVYRHKDYFQHIQLHLTPFFFASYAHTFLSKIWDQLSIKSEFPEHKIYSLAMDLGFHEEWDSTSVLQFLHHDVYLQYDKTKKTFRMKSPLIKSWWASRLPEGQTETVVEESPTNGKEFKSIKIQGLNIRDIKCFNTVDIPFDSPGNSSIIIGNNGKGKSTILQLLALGLSGAPNVPFTYNWKETVKKGCPNGSFELRLIFDNRPLTLRFEINPEDDTISCTNGAEHLEEIRGKFILLAYGANRGIKLEEAKPYKDIEPIATLFGENAYLKHIKLSSTYEHVGKHFETIRALINRVLEAANGGGNVTLTAYDSNSLYFTTPSNREKQVPIEALSEGFKSTFVWLFDAIIRMVEKGGRLDNTGDITGVILLDEIDLHLHSTWQRTILHSVEALFPNIRFIVTTHSPFVVQSASREALIPLEQDPETDGVVAVDKNITSELSYNAIVKEIFNISFPFSRDIEIKMDKFRNIQQAIRKKQPYDEDEFRNLVMDIASKGVELEGIMRREIRSLEQRVGKSFDLWKK